MRPVRCRTGTQCAARQSDRDKDSHGSGSCDPKGHMPAADHERKAPLWELCVVRTAKGPVWSRRHEAADGGVQRE